MHPDFKEIITQVWDNNPTLENVVHLFARKASAWACTNIGNIFARKNRLLRRTKGIQQSNNYFYSPFLHNLAKDLIVEFSIILKMEEDFWKMKSRINCRNEGDTNTKFFHTSTLIRRKK